MSKIKDNLISVLNVSSIFIALAFILLIVIAMPINNFPAENKRWTQTKEFSIAGGGTQYIIRWLDDNKGLQEIDLYSEKEVVDFENHLQ